MDIIGAIRDLRDQLKANGVKRAAIDGQDVNPPGVWLAMNRISDLTGCGGELYVDLFVVAPDVPDAQALNQLTKQLSDLTSALDALGLPYGDITAEQLQPASGGSPLPALKTTTQLTV